VRELRFPARSAEVPHRVANLPYNSLGPLFKGRDVSLVELRQQLRATRCQVIHGLGSRTSGRLHREESILVHGIPPRWVATREVVLAWYDERLMKYPSSVAATWQTTVGQLAWPERGLLNMLAWFAPEPIPVSLLEGVSVDSADARDALSGLVSWSLAGWTAGGDNLTVHRLVQEITRQRLFGGQKESSLAGALKILDAKLPSPDWNQKDWEMWERLASHCRALVGHLSDYVLEPKARRMMNLFAGWLRSRAEYGEAASVFERSLALTEMELGPENPEVAISLNNLAVLYKDQGYYAKAEGLYKRALAIDEKALGPDDESVATTLNNLARLWHAQGQYAKAEPLYERAVAIWKKALGPENAKVAAGFNNLAQLYSAEGQGIKAKPLLTQALAIREKALDPDHPDLATNLNDLAQLYADEGDYAKAEPLLQRAPEDHWPAPSSPLPLKCISHLGGNLSFEKSISTTGSSTIRW
jgi:tetratricopeptide (TPR) repeat protein